MFHRNIRVLSILFLHPLINCIQSSCNFWFGVLHKGITVCSGWKYKEKKLRKHPLLHPILYYIIIPDYLSVSLTPWLETRVKNTNSISKFDVLLNHQKQSCWLFDYFYEIINCGIFRIQLGVKRPEWYAQMNSYRSLKDVHKIISPQIYFLAKPRCHL